MAERQSLEQRSNELRRWDGRASSRDLGVEVTKFLQGFPHGKLSAQEAAMTVAEYVTALHDLPIWATRQAMQRFRRAEVDRDTHTFAPSCAELRLAALDVTEPYRSELSSITRLLSAEVYQAATDAERERVHAAIEALASDLRTRAPRDPYRRDKQTLADTMKAASDRLRAKDLAAAGIDDGLKLSLGMREKLALIRADEAAAAKRKEAAE
jgi:hypothetical protein